MKLIIGLALAGLACGADKVTTLRVKAVASTSQDKVIRSGSVTIPGNQRTNCNAIGSSVTCNTTGAPSTTIPGDSGYAVIHNRVEAHGMSYLLECNTKLGWSTCSELTAGDEYDATLKGTEMVLEAHKGGNMGKLVKIKMKLLDMRPVEK